MSNKFDCLFYGPVPTSIINEPVVDFVVNFAVKAETALERAGRRWRYAELISGERDHER